MLGAKSPIRLFDPAADNADEVTEDLRAELAVIYQQYLTSRPRKTGRLEALAFSLGQPDYDPAWEVIEAIQAVKNGFEIKTRKRYADDDYIELYQYKLKVENNRLLIDSKAYYSDFKEKWVRDIL